MSVERSHFLKSLSLGEINIKMFNQKKPIESSLAHREKCTDPTIATKTTQKSVKISKPTVTIPDQSARCIFELSSPIRMTDKEKSEMNTDERYGVFLEACYYCKKKFSKKDDIFMYRYLRAFCTPECREEQMALDKEVENDPEESLEEIEVMEQWINRLKGRCIFELSSPVQMTDKEKSEMNTDERYGVFLEACYYCKKKFDEKDDIFMYRYLHAFCAPKCREEQMTLDKEVENDPEESMEEIEEMEQWINRLKGRFGAH